MKLSVCLPMFFKKTPLDVAIRSAFSLGYNAAELWSLPKDVDVDAVAAACNECSFTLVAFCPDKFNMTDSALHGEYLESLESVEVEVYDVDFNDSTGNFDFSIRL